jgi:hypothetical protein
MTRSDGSERGTLNTGKVFLGNGGALLRTIHPREKDIAWLRADGVVEPTNL